MKRLRAFSLLAIAAIVVIAFSGRYASFYVVSSSMSPNIPPGSLVIAELGASYGIGDVVLYERRVGIGEISVMHRVVGIRGDLVELKGDASAASELIERREIKAKVLIAIPLLGNIASILARSPAPAIAAAAMLVALPRGFRPRNGGWALAFVTSWSLGVAVAIVGESRLFGRGFVTLMVLSLAAIARALESNKRYGLAGYIYAASITAALYSLDVRGASSILWRLAGQ